MIFPRLFGPAVSRCAANARALPFGDSIFFLICHQSDDFRAPSTAAT
jgi:hypothetical protein